MPTELSEYIRITSIQKTVR